jgi:hypothetical protein
MSTKNGGTTTGKVVKEKSKGLIAREAKEAESVARFNAQTSKVMDVLSKPKASVKEPKQDPNWEDPAGARLVDRLNAEKKPKANGKSKPKAKAPVKPKVDRAAERRSFIKQNGPTILKAWDALEEGKRSGAALNRTLPSTWSCKWIDEVLMLAGLRQSGEQVVIKAVAEDKPFLKNGQKKANSEVQVPA